MDAAPTGGPVDSKPARGGAPFDRDEKAGGWMDAREISCTCGRKMTLSTPKLRCEQCGRNIFYDEKERLRHRASVAVTTILMLSAFGLVAYLFIEMVAVPFFPR
jgi:DNA-directed RNA polymerase subunit RPC12/RpoP